MFIFIVVSSLVSQYACVRLCVCVCECVFVLVSVYLCVLICFLPGYLSCQLSVAWQGSQSTLFMINRHVYCRFFFYIMLLFIHIDILWLCMWLIVGWVSCCYSNLKYLFNNCSWFIRIIIGNRVWLLIPESREFFYL